MRTIRWIGSTALLAAATIITLLASAGASPGDVLHPEQTGRAVLNAPQKAQLGGFVTSLWSSTSAGNIVRLRCKFGLGAQGSPSAACRAWARKTGTAAEFVLAEGAGAGAIVSVSGSVVTYNAALQSESLTQAQIDSAHTFAQGLWSGIADGSLRRIVVLRDDTSGDVIARATYLAISTPAAYATKRQAGTASTQVGIVE